MALWSTPVIHATGDVVSAGDWNINSDDLLYLDGTITIPGWTNVASFTNSWTAPGGASYILIANVVYLRGEIQSGTAGQSAFTLPSGYAPANTSWFTVSQGSGGTSVNTVEVTSAGLVIPTLSANTWLSQIAYPTLS